MNYDDLPVGHELDEPVAEKVLGWKFGKPGMLENYCQPPPYKFGVIHRDKLPSFSTDIPAAWEVFLNVCDRPFSVRRKFFSALQEQTKLPSGEYVAWPDVLVVLRNNMPEAICRAALKAVDP